MGLIEKLKEKLKGRVPEDVDLDDLLKDLDSASSKDADLPKQHPASQPANTPAPGVDALSEMRQQFLQLQQQLAALQEALAEEKKARQEAVRALEEQRKREQEKRIAELLDSAIQAGKIPPGKRDEWKQRLEQAFDLTKQIIEELPANPAVGKEGSKEGEPQHSPATTQQTFDRAALVEAAKSYFRSKAATN